ncbi:MULTISPECIES: hypothetical protein [unclassified Shewanella]|uniref:hypothetical protein n=1 Tax=Shewanella TaxID=22 RepID=UPI0021D86AF9|nr:MULTISPECIES: hypothetical protein [unclassified Shewanella]MCU8020258.1 hypothetical protein [Shewanella sp. SM78]MCU8042581.1 hypothetical protein [Shewanella sp. SM68]MCU8046956.1 hypothetical protein [Shewanella sp. SM65]MCU8077274.1 hypothetical protein [Shewanella sp. SM103]
MSTFVKLTIAATLVVLALLAAGIYRFNMTNDDIYMVMEDGQVMQYDEAMAHEKTQAQANEIETVTPFEVKPVANASEVMLKLFSLNTANPVEITLPEGGKSVALTHFIKIKQTEFAMGDYQDGEIKGRALLDYLRITPLNFDPALEPDTQSDAPIQDDPKMQTMPFVAPFIVTTQGSGVFWYLGLFNLDFKHNSLKHLGSVMLGDRIEVDSIEPVYPFEAPFKIAVTYRDRASDQPMSESPEIVKTIEMIVSETSLHK